MMSQAVITQINIRETIKSKNARLYKLLPNFIIRYIERIIHQNEINVFLQKHGEKQDLDFINAIMDDHNVEYTINGEHNIPKEGRYIFASNHPLGGFDGIMLMHYMQHKFPAFKFLVNDILMELKNLGGLFLPINKHGKQGRNSTESIENAFASNMQILTFPFGLVSRRQKGVIKDLEWKKNFISKAVQYKRDIIPVHISGRNSNFFYNLSSIRKFFGIKANLEMFYLGDETFQHFNKSFIISFGKPIPYSTFKEKRNYKKWANLIKEHAYRIGENPDVEFEG